MQAMIFLTIFLSLAASSYSAEFIPEYTAAAIRAAGRGNGELVENLVQKGADPNATDVDGRTLLLNLCMRCYDTPVKNVPVETLINRIKFLISHGANVNLADSYGVTALIIADRVGNEVLVELLKLHGATDPDWTNIKIKAAATLVDGELLMNGIHYLNTIDGKKWLHPPTLSYEEAELWLAGSKVKVALSSGKDLFGRTFILSAVNGGIVSVHPDTLIEIEKEISLRPDYWKRLDQRVGKN